MLQKWSEGLQNLLATHRPTEESKWNSAVSNLLISQARLWVVVVVEWQSMNDPQATTRDWFGIGALSGLGNITNVVRSSASVY